MRCVPRPTLYLHIQNCAHQINLLRAEAQRLENLSAVPNVGVDDSLNGPINPDLEPARLARRPGRHSRLAVQLAAPVAQPWTQLPAHPSQPSVQGPAPSSQHPTLQIAQPHAIPAPLTTLGQHELHPITAAALPPLLYGPQSSVVPSSAPSPLMMFPGTRNFSPMLPSSFPDSPAFMQTPSEEPPVSLANSPTLPGPDYALPGSRPRKRPRALGQQSRQTSISEPVQVSWSDSQHARFEWWIARLTASCGFPLSWVENPIWLAFCAEYIPQAIVPSRKVLTKRIIPTEVKRLRASHCAKWVGNFAMLQQDGWTGMNHHHFSAFMTTIARQVSGLYY